MILIFYYLYFMLDDLISKLSVCILSYDLTLLGFDDVLITSNDLFPWWLDDILGMSSTGNFGI